MIISLSIPTSKYDLNLLKELEFDSIFYDISDLQRDFQINFVFFDVHKNRCVISWELEQAKRSKDWYWNPPFLTVNGNRFYGNFRAKIPMDFRNFLDEHLQNTKNRLLALLVEEFNILSIGNVRITKNSTSLSNYFKDIVHADVFLNSFKSSVQLNIEKSILSDFSWSSSEPELHFILKHNEPLQKFLSGRVLNSPEVNAVKEIDFSMLRSYEREAYVKMEIQALKKIKDKLLKEQAILTEATKKIKEYEQDIARKENEINNILK